MRGPDPFTTPFTPFDVTVFGGFLNPGGGLFELSKGDGDDWEDFTPLTDVCTIGGGGRFIFWGGGPGLEDTAVAIGSV